MVKTKKLRVKFNRDHESKLRSTWQGGESVGSQMFAGQKAKYDTDPVPEEHPQHRSKDSNLATRGRYLLDHFQSRRSSLDFLQLGMILGTLLFYFFNNFKRIIFCCIGGPPLL